MLAVFEIERSGRALVMSTVLFAFGVTAGNVELSGFTAEAESTFWPEFVRFETVHRAVQVSPC